MRAQSIVTKILEAISHHLPSRTKSSLLKEKNICDFGSHSCRIIKSLMFLVINPKPLRYNEKLFKSLWEKEAQKDGTEYEWLHQHPL